MINYDQCVHFDLFNVGIADKNNISKTNKDFW